MNTHVTDNIMPLDPLAKAAHHARSIGAILVASGKISAEDAERVMDLQRSEGWRFGEAALRLRLISQTDLNHALHKQYGLPLMLPVKGTRLSRELVAAYHPVHERTEELRALRTQLLIRWFRQPTVEQQVLAIVSPGRGEGRSYVAANLAALFAQMGERTLLIDADLRNPRQHAIFKLPDRVGLSSVLGGRAGANAIVPVPGFNNLALLPAGAPPPNPLELLKTCLADFDVILVDTPPALLYSDAQAVGFRAGSAIVLTRKDHTRLSDANRVVHSLADAGTRVVGSVINAY
jgi:protein-tyrosine kinase